MKFKKKTLLMVLAALSVCATAFAYTETWYIWRCVNCGRGAETNYNSPPSITSNAGSEACPYDSIKGHRFKCVGTKQVYK